MRSLVEKENRAEEKTNIMQKTQNKAKTIEQKNGRIRNREFYRRKIRREIRHFGEHQPFHRRGKLTVGKKKWSSIGFVI